MWFYLRSHQILNSIPTPFCGFTSILLSWRLNSNLKGMVALLVWKEELAWDLPGFGVLENLAVQEGQVGLEGPQLRQSREKYLSQQALKEVLLVTWKRRRSKAHSIAQQWACWCVSRALPRMWYKQITSWGTTEGLSYSCGLSYAWKLSSFTKEKISWFLFCG